MSAVATRVASAAEAARRLARPVRSTFQPGRVAPRDGRASPEDVRPPLVVLVHGLESHSGTFDAVASYVAARPPPTPSLLAVDLRGHGLTPVGPELEFLPANLAADVAACAATHAPGERVVLVGHSMGGRVAVRLAADYPELVSHLIVEDMDATLMCADHARAFFGADADDRPDAPKPAPELERARAFDPAGDSAESLAANLSAVAPNIFTAERVAGYLARGRVYEVRSGADSVNGGADSVSGGADSDARSFGRSLIHPLGFALACRRVLASRDGVAAFSSLARLARKVELEQESDPSPPHVPAVHLWRAPEGDREAGGGITADRGSQGGRAVGSIDWIEETFGRRVDSPDADDARVDVRVATFEGAGHSVHNTRLEAFAEALVEVAVRGVGVVGKV